MMIIYFIEEEVEAIERLDLMFLLLKAFVLRKQISSPSKSLFFIKRQIIKPQEGSCNFFPASV